MIFTWMKAAWLHDNPEFGHGLHLAIGWVLGLLIMVFCVGIAAAGWRDVAFFFQVALTILAAVRLAFHEVQDQDFTLARGGPWNGVCDALAFQPGLWLMLPAPWGWTGLAFLLLYAIALAFRGRSLPRG